MVGMADRHTEGAEGKKQDQGKPDPQITSDKEKDTCQAQKISAHYDCRQTQQYTNLLCL